MDVDCVSLQLNHHRLILVSQSFRNRNSYVILKCSNVKSVINDSISMCFYRYLSNPNISNFLQSILDRHINDGKKLLDLLKLEVAFSIFAKCLKFCLTFYGTLESQFVSHRITSCLKVPCNLVSECVIALTIGIPIYIYICIYKRISISIYKFITIYTYIYSLTSKLLNIVSVVCYVQRHDLYTRGTPRSVVVIL